MLIFLWKGLWIGFSVAAPVGPIGVLCIRRTLQNGRISGLVSGLGASTASFLYVSTLAFGVSILSDFILGISFWVRLLGGIFLLYLGATTFFSRPTLDLTQSQESNLTQDYFSSFLLNLTNPMTIVPYMAILAGLELELEISTLSPAFFVIGIFLGSALWWFLLTHSISTFRHKLNQTTLIWVNRCGGLIMFSFGLYAILQARA